MQKKRKVSEAEEETDERRFAFQILKAPFTPGIKGLLCFRTRAGVNIMQQERSMSKNKCVRGCVHSLCGVVGVCFQKKKTHTECLALDISTCKTHLNLGATIIITRVETLLRKAVIWGIFFCHKALRSCGCAEGNVRDKPR